MRVVSLIFGLLLSLTLGELIFYLGGYPSNYAQPMSMPGTLEPDALTGWKHKPGQYFFESSGKDSYKFQFSILNDGSRRSSENFDNSKPAIVILGCSFLEGLGLDDKHTFAWKLQELLPDYSVINLAVGGYGTIHSLLRLKQYIASRKEGDPPAFIVYGFADFHTLRNIKNPVMHRSWHSKGIFPYCDKENCGTWEGYSMGSFLERSRVFSMIENLWDSLKLLPLRSDADSITMKLILEMQEQTKNNNLKFAVAPVSLDDSSWIDNFSSKHVPVIECDDQLLHSAAYRLSDGHPNQLWSDRFAHCIEGKLKPMLMDLKH